MENLLLALVVLATSTAHAVDPFAMLNNPNRGAVNNSQVQSAQTASGGNQSAGGGAQGAGGGAGGGPKYEKNKTTEELAKAAKPYIEQMNKTTEATIKSISEGTQKWMADLKNLAVPDVGDGIIKAAADITGQIRSLSSVDVNKQTDDLNAQLAANTKTLLDTIKAQSVTLAGAPPPPAVEPTQAMKSNGDQLTQFASSLPRRTATSGARNSLDAALGSTALTSGADAIPQVGSGLNIGATRSHLTGAQAFQTSSSSATPSGGATRGVQSGGYNVPSAIRKLLKD